jgi:hypothetical protein
MSIDIADLLFPLFTLSCNPLESIYLAYLLNVFFFFNAFILSDFRTRRYVDPMNVFANIEAI